MFFQNATCSSLPAENSIFNCHNPKDIKLQTRRHLRFSHLSNRKFKSAFQDTHPSGSYFNDIKSLMEEFDLGY